MPREPIAASPIHRAASGHVPQVAGVSDGDLRPLAASTGSRIGIFGGSFDPPHLAHLALGELALRQLRLDELLWLPAGQPWQKAGRRLADGAHRVAMLDLLIAGRPGHRIDPRELHRGGLSYTLDTVRELQAQPPVPAPADWFLVIGQDQYARFDTWHGWPELLQRLTLAVAAREGQAVQPPAALADVPHRCVPLALPRLDISASVIRARCGRGEPVAPLVGPGVAGYIAHHHLYEAARG